MQSGARSGRFMHCESLFISIVVLYVKFYVFICALVFDDAVVLILVGIMAENPFSPDLSPKL